MEGSVQQDVGSRMDTSQVSLFDLLISLGYRLNENYVATLISYPLSKNRFTYDAML